MLTLPIPTADATPVSAAESDAVIDGALTAVREHLGMPIGYLSEFVGERSIFRHVDAPGLEHVIKPGDSRPLEEIYCRHVLEGRLPQMIPDTGAIALARDLPVTAQTPIGSHASVPIRRADGSVYGMFCCLSPEPNASLNARDLAVMEMFAGLASEQLRHRSAAEEERRVARARIGAAIEGETFRLVAQPIYDLARGRLVGLEALCRFDRPFPAATSLDDDADGPGPWFDAARGCGMAVALEVAVVRRALDLAAGLPPRATLWINVSPETLVSAALAAAVDGAAARRVILEVTEHDELDETRGRAAIAEFRQKGVQVALDDVGVGQAGLSRILRLAPDAIKLDRSLVRDVDRDRSKRALVAAMSRFSRDCGITLVAEGIETEAELAALKGLRVERGQGFLLGRPGAPSRASPIVSL